MTPERMAALVLAWVRLYTRDVPGPIAERRRGELEADMHDQIAHERAHGTGERRIALGLAGRMLRGMCADVAWRGRTLTNHIDQEAPLRLLSRSAVRVALVTTVLLLVPLIAMLAGDAVDWGVFDFVFAGVLVAGAGFVLELAVRSRGRFVPHAAAATIGVAAMVLGELDDAPGLSGFGLLLLLGASALVLTRLGRRGLRPD